MNVITKYLKKSAFSIFIVVILLIIQAFCDLSLPGYTSNIVNIGIQQSGIEEIAPKIIAEDEMENLLLFMSDDDKATVMSNYTLLSKDDLGSSLYNEYIKDYPLLASENIYKKNENTKKINEKLNNIFTKPVAIVSNIESGKEEFKNLEIYLQSTLPADMVNPNLDLFDIFHMISKDQLIKITANLENELDKIPESLLSQAGVSYVREQYSKVGIDVDKEQMNYIFTAGAKMIGLTLISMASIIAVAFYASKIAALLGERLRKDVFEKVISFSNAEFDRFSTASLITRTTNDIQQIQNMMVILMRMVFYAPILAVGGILKVLRTNNSMAWIILIALIAIILIVGVLFGLAMPKFKKLQILVDKLNQTSREILTGLSVIRAFNNEKYEENRFDISNKELTKTNLFVNRIMTFMMPSMMFIMNAITILIVWVGSYSIDSGLMQVGNLMEFIQYSMQIIMAFLMISMISVVLPRALVCAKRISEVLNTEEVINDPEVKESFKNDKKGYVEYKNVSFKFPNAEEYVLKDINFTAKPGETTAIIGSTGSGKSTLVNLIPRFYDVTEGTILIDGVDIRNVSQHDLRDKLGFVPQKGVLFSGTIESNIKYGKKNATVEEMKKAARIAQAEEFIEAKPEKYNTDIAQGGSNVSGGQKQRLSIARAIAKDPEIYVFDDSFSALDYKTDVALRKALREEIKESTIIIVAQRISTVLNANQILVLDEGKIVGKGTHKELMKNCEVYKQIAYSQLSKEELAKDE